MNMLIHPERGAIMLAMFVAGVACGGCVAEVTPCGTVPANTGTGSGVVRDHVAGRARVEGAGHRNAGLRSG